MKRRDLLVTASVAAIAQAAFGKTPATQTEKWSRDGMGSLARIGVLTPTFDPVPESELWAMAPNGISIHAARVPRKTDQSPAAFAAPPEIDAATEQLATLNPQVIVYAYTSSSYLLGPSADAALRDRLQKRANGTPVVLTCASAVAALRALGTTRVALIHPPWFGEETSLKGASYFEGMGFDVLSCARISPARSFTEVQPAEVFEAVLKNAPPNAQAVFVGGNGLRAVGAIKALEDALQKPVLTANQVNLWAALRAARLSPPITDYGHIFHFAAS